MSSTNKTEHYNLSQYIGTDKPTYLGDYNSDMAKIDTGINNAQAKADSADGKAETAQSTAEQANQNASSSVTLAQTASQNATEALNKVGEANAHANEALEKAEEAKTTADSYETDITTANSKATEALEKAEASETAIGDITSLNTTNKSNLTSAVNEVNTGLNGTKAGLTAFEKKFNLNYTSSKTNTTTFITGITFIECNLRLAQNEDGSIFKFYGHLISGRSGGSGSYLPSGSKVPMGTTSGSYTGYDTGLILRSAPAGAYKIEGSGIVFHTSSSGSVDSVVTRPFIVGANGHIYIDEQYYYDNKNVINTYPASIYFNSSFGD